MEDRDESTSGLGATDQGDGATGNDWIDKLPKGEPTETAETPAAEATGEQSQD